MVGLQLRKMEQMNQHRIRVLHVHGDLIAGGGQVLSREWLASIDRSRFEPFVVVLNQPTTLKSSFEDNEIRVTEIFGNRIAQIIKLAKYIRKNKIDIVHTQSEPDRKVGHWAALITRRPVVAHAHSAWVYFAGENQANVIKQLRSSIMLKARKISERSVVAFIATSQVVADSFSQLTSKPITVVEPGVSIRNAVYSADEKLQAKNKMGLEKNQRLIVNASRLDDLKNLDDFILAIAKMRAEVDVVGFIYGEGEDKTDLEQLIENVGCKEFIKILEPVTDLVPVFGAADIFLATSLSESFGMSVLESLSQGLPVVAYDLEAYERYGDGICRVSLNDVDALVSQSIKILNSSNYANEIVEKGIQACKDFDITVGTKKLEAIYSKNTQKISNK